jgi:hypothetical protein
MKAIVIDGQSRTLSLADISDREAIVELIGQPSVISDSVDDANLVYFDEDCFIRGTEGRFQIDSLAPIAGKAVVLGGSEGAPADTDLDVDALRARITFL